MRRREAATLVALIDAVVAPEPPLPPVRATDAPAAFAAWLAAAPRVNRIGVRAALAALEVAPLRARFSALPRAGRLDVLRGLQRRGATRGAAEALRSAAAVSYYGDEGVLRALGHDPAARVREARARRRREAVA
jgi:hypothetical protein